MCGMPYASAITVTIRSGFAGALGHIETVAALRPCYVIITVGSSFVLSVLDPHWALDLGKSSWIDCNPGIRSDSSPVHLPL